MDSQTDTWSSNDDACVVWLCLSCPFSEFGKQITILNERTPKEIVERFITILNSKELTERVNKECKNDILSFRQVPWTKEETYQLIRLCTENKKFNPRLFINKYPNLFHPSRTPSTLQTAYDKTKARGQATHDMQASIIKKFHDDISALVKSHELLPFPGLDEPNATINNIIKEETGVSTEKAESSEFSYDVIAQRVAGRWTNKIFAALVGLGEVRMISSTRVVFGRASPKRRPDIDLADLNLQSISRLHCAITLRLDLNFYLQCIGPMVIVNGSVYMKDSIIKIKDRDVIDIGGAPFVFFENKDLLAQLRSTK